MVIWAILHLLWFHPFAIPNTFHISLPVKVYSRFQAKEIKYFHNKKIFHELQNNSWTKKYFLCRRQWAGRRRARWALHDDGGQHAAEQLTAAARWAAGGRGWCGCTRAAAGGGRGPGRVGGAAAAQHRPPPPQPRRGQGAQGERGHQPRTFEKHCAKKISL